MHTPVLLQEIITLLRPQPGGVFIDATLGAGGHAQAILEASAPDGQLFGFDQDRQALEIAAERLEQFADRVTLFHANFKHLVQTAQRHKIPPANGILLDIGVSSMQLDTPERGFSFQADGPLDMRMNPTSGQPASELVNNLPETELANLIFRYGEEPKSRQIARAIVKARPITGTQQLADIIARASGRPGQRKRHKIHPATRSFQALRVAVNDELAVLEQVLPQALRLLKPQGRLAVISFNSLEDRIVKQYFRQEAQDCICPPEQPVCSCKHKAIITIITKKPITPSSAEVDVNPRARSAKLRVVELKGQ